MKNIDNRYNAQALAIAMVVLVVSSIIGLAIYSRAAKDKLLSVGERASAEALEVSDLILNQLITIPINTVTQTIAGEGNPFDYENGVTLTESNGQISELFTKLGLEGAFTGLNFCPIATDGNEYYLKIKEASPDTYFEIRAGQVMAFPIKGQAIGLGCNASLSFAIRGDSNVGFSVEKIYGQNYTSGIAQEYKPYAIDDVKQYCFSCNETKFLGDEWNHITDGGSLTFDLNETADGYKLDEIRVKAIGGSLGVGYILTTECTQGFRLIDVQASANCDGTYRGKQILIPEKKWSSPVFDYSLFNGQGSL